MKQTVLEQFKHGSYFETTEGLGQRGATPRIFQDLLPSLVRFQANLL
jgi:hypothetical protein